MLLNRDADIAPQIFNCSIIFASNVAAAVFKVSTHRCTWPSRCVNVYNKNTCGTCGSTFVVIQLPWSHSKRPYSYHSAVTTDIQKDIVDVFLYVCRHCTVISIRSLAVRSADLNVYKRRSACTACVFVVYVDSCLKDVQRNVIRARIYVNLSLHTCVVFCRRPRLFLMTNCIIRLRVSLSEWSDQQ